MRHLPLFLSISLVCSLAFAGPKQEAKKHVDKAMKAHADGKFHIALSELRAAYKLDPQPDLLYAMGQVYSKLGRCTDATAAFERFRKAKHADPSIGKVVDEAVAACKHTSDSPFVDAQAADVEPAKAASKGEPAKTASKVEPTKAASKGEMPAPPPPTELPPPVAPPPPPVTQPTPPVTQPTPPPSMTPPASVAPALPPVAANRPWYTDALGDALLATGVVGLAGAGFEFRAARTSIDDSAHATTLAQYTHAVDDAHHKRTYSLIIGGAGAALVAGALVHYKLHGKHAESHVAIVPASGGGILCWTGGL
jgi:hypothetical protein